MADAALALPTENLRPRRRLRALRKLEEIEHELIKLAIEKYDGHMSEVARRLGIGRSTLYRKLREMGIEDQQAGGA